MSFVVIVVDIYVGTSSQLRTVPLGLCEIVSGWHARRPPSTAGSEPMALSGVLTRHVLFHALPRNALSSTPHMVAGAAGAEATYQDRACC